MFNVERGQLLLLIKKRILSFKKSMYFKLNFEKAGV